jgi:hypothetical protein
MFNNEGEEVIQCLVACVGSKWIRVITTRGVTSSSE